MMVSVVDRSEYVKLQQKCNSLERENALLAAQAGSGRPQDSFVGRLVATVSALYNRPLYSDLTIRTPASSLYAHKFVLRSGTKIIFFISFGPLILFEGLN